MTTEEYESTIRDAAVENGKLNNRIRELEDELEAQSSRRAPPSHSDLDDNPLCKGCFQWRMGASGVAGIVLGIVALGFLQDHPTAVRELAASITGNAKNAGPIQVALAVLTVIAPGLATFGEWQWTLYRHGHPGIIRRIAEIGEAFKKGRKHDV